MVKMVTNHGKIRIKERVGNTRSNSLLRTVLDSGNSKYDYKDSFFHYLVSKENQKHAKIKVYKDNIYVLSKNTKRLVTTYPIPEKFLPINKYEITAREKKIINFLFRNSDYKIIFVVNDEEIEGNVLFIKDKPIDTIMIQKDNEEICIKIELINTMISPVEYFHI